MKAKPEGEEIGRIHLDSRTHTENQAGTARHQKGQSMKRNLPEAQLHRACGRLSEEPGTKPGR